MFTGIVTDIGEVRSVKPRAGDLHRIIIACDYPRAELIDGASISCAGVCMTVVGAGEEWDKFVASAVARNCAGVECLSGIPGSVGGTPVQNVGAYGQEVSETIRSVTALDLNRDNVCELANAECAFH